MIFAMLPDEIEVEVTYAGADRQEIIRLKVLVGTTVAEAIAQSRIEEHFPEIDPARNKVGIFGKIVREDTVLRHRDRVEIYRPLMADPKDARRKRAEAGKTRKNG